MKITINVDDIDYNAIIPQIIPLIIEKLKNENKKKSQILSSILSASGDIPIKIMNSLPQENKEDLIIYLINSNKEKLKKLINKNILEKGIGLEVREFDVEK